MPAAPLRDARRAAGACWRVVEGQHHVSTLALVDSLAEQERLERLIDATKPTVPIECRDLHYLLFTPFRYRPYPRGSRFRPAGLSPGVFYASAEVETAIAELAFYRLLFFAESPATPWPSNASEHTTFSMRYGSGKAIDLTRPPFLRRRKDWMHPTDYAPCQALADEARAAGVEIIRFASVRDPQHRLNIALLTCRAFRAKAPAERQSWRIRVGSTGVQAVRDFPRSSLEFGRDTFAADPRIAEMDWRR
ncbi:RES family NAD+ phosphorylase [Dongia deserti]|uniref:RES family NAD+ phosphorylase n=1 Tax=Dongia deserti TaxID=2268030 RepID=UPI000E64C4B7|nr:RES family NAD+ phosphorylase [Dongia deserti]